MKHQKYANAFVQWLESTLYFWGVELNAEKLLAINEVVQHVMFMLIRLKRSYHFDVDSQLDLIETFETFRNSDNEVFGDSANKALDGAADIYRANFSDECIQLLVIGDMKRAVDDGSSYIKGMKGWFNDELLMLYTASASAKGEANTIKRMTKSFEQQRALKKSIYKVFYFPLIYLLTGVGISLATTEFLLPIFNAFLPDGFDGTAINAVKIQSGLILDFGLAMLVALLTFTLVVSVSKPLWYGSNRVLVDQHFPYSTYRTFESARFFKLVALLQRSEKNLKESIQILRPLLSPYLRWHAERILVGINQGQNKKDYFARDLLSKFQAIRLHANLEQRSRGLPDALLRIGETADFDAQMSINDSVQNVRNGLLLFATTILLISILGFGEMLEQFILHLSTLN